MDEEFAVLTWGKTHTHAHAFTHTYPCTQTHTRRVLVDEEFAVLTWGKPEVNWAIGSLSERLAAQVSTALSEVGLFVHTCVCVCLFVRVCVCELEEGKRFPV